MRSILSQEKLKYFKNTKDINVMGYEMGLVAIIMQMGISIMESGRMIGIMVMVAFIDARRMLEVKAKILVL